MKKNLWPDSPENPAYEFVKDFGKEYWSIGIKHKNMGMFIYLSEENMQEISDFWRKQNEPRKTGK